MWFGLHVFGNTMHCLFVFCVQHLYLIVNMFTMLFIEIIVWYFYVILVLSFLLVWGRPGGSTKALKQTNKIWRGGKCSGVAVPPYTLYLSLTATPLFLLVAVAIGMIGLEYNAAHSSVARLLSRLSSVVVGQLVVACRHGRRTLASSLTMMQ